MLAFITLGCVVYTLITQYKGYDLTQSYFAYLCFYYWISFNAVRQMLAVSIVFWGLKYVFKGGMRKFLFAIFAAASIHISALFAIPIYFLWDRKRNAPLNNKIVGIIVLIGMIATISWRYVLAVFIVYGGEFTRKFNRYLTGGDTGRNRDIYVYILLLAVFVLFSKMLVKRDKRNKLYIYMYLFSVIIAFTGFQIATIKRLAWFYQLPYILLIGMIPGSFKNNFSRDLIKGAIMIFHMFYFTLVTYLLEKANIIPYQWK